MPTNNKFWRFRLLCDFFTEDLHGEQTKNKMLQEDMEATLNDIQNM